MCIDASMDTARTERLRQHARDFKNERTASDAMHPGFPVAPGWAMARDESGHVAIVPETRTRQQPRMSWRLRYLLLAMWSTSISVVIWTIASLAPYLPKAITWVASHLGTVAAAISL